jgi:hypothetical protein
MLFPPLGAHISYAEFQYPDRIWKELCGQMANLVAESGGNKEKWKVFESLWNRKYMRSDYNLALSQQQSYDFQDELKWLFG